MNDVRATMHGPAGASRWVQCSANPALLAEPLVSAHEPVALRAADPPARPMRSLLDAHTARYGYHQLEEASLDLFALSEAERCVARCLLKGMTYERIADLMHLSRSTVKGYARSVFAKASVPGRSEFERHIHRLIERL